MPFDLTTACSILYGTDAGDPSLQAGTPAEAGASSPGPGGLVPPCEPPGRLSRDQLADIALEQSDDIDDLRLRCRRLEVLLRVARLMLDHIDLGRTEGGERLAWMIDEELTREAL